MNFCQTQGRVPVCPDTSVTERIPHISSIRHFFFYFIFLDFSWLNLKNECVWAETSSEPEALLYSQTPALPIQPWDIWLLICQHSGTTSMHDTDIRLLPTIEMYKLRHTHEVTHSQNELIVEMGLETKCWSFYSFAQNIRSQSIMASAQQHQCYLPRRERTLLKRLSSSHIIRSTEEEEKEKIKTQTTE